MRDRPDRLRQRGFTASMDGATFLAFVFGTFSTPVERMRSTGHFR